MAFSRLKMIMTEDELSRLVITDYCDGGLQIIVDVHGMKCSDAKRFINNVINTVHYASKLIIIHGYNHGTAIKEMLDRNFSNPHIRKQYHDMYNQGITHMLIAA